MVKKTDVEILDREVSENPWAAKPLSLARTARLIDFLGAVFANTADRMQVEVALSQDGETAINPILALLKVLDEDCLAGLLSIITGQTKTWVSKNWRLKDVTEALRDFIRQEDLGEILGNLGESRGLLAGVLATETSTGSLESSTDSLVPTEAPQSSG